MSEDRLENLPLEDRWTFLRIIHPTHLEYIKKLPLNTVNYYLNVLDSLDPDKRYEIIQYSAYYLLVPFMDGEKLNGLMSQPKMLYSVFKQKCLDYAKGFNECLMVQGLVHHTLHVLSMRGDITNIDKTKDKLIGIAEFVQSHGDESEREESESFVDHLVETATNVPEQTEESYTIYIFFCENVLSKLLKQTAYV